MTRFIVVRRLIHHAKFFRDLGVQIEDDGNVVTIHGVGFAGLQVRQTN